MKWVSNYLLILKTANTIGDEKATLIYREAFKALINYGLADYDEENNLYVLNVDGEKYELQNLENENNIHSVNDVSEQLETISESETEEEDVQDLPEAPEVSSEQLTSESNFESETVEPESNVEEIELENEVEVENDIENNSQEMDSNVEKPEQPSSPSTSESSEDSEGKLDSEYDSNGENNIFESESETESGDFGDFNPFANETNDDIEGGNSVNPFESPDDSAFDDESGSNPFAEEPVASPIEPEANPFDSNSDSTIEESNENGFPETTSESGLFGESEDKKTPSDETDEVGKESDESLDINLTGLPLELPTHLDNKDFTFDLHTLKSKDGKENCVFLVAPLRLDLSRSEVIVQAVINNHKAVEISDENGQITFETDDYSYFIDASIKNKEFVSEVKVKEGTEDNFTTRRISFGKKGHIVQVDEEDGIKIHIIPTSFQSNEYGTADFIYCIESESEGKEQIDFNYGSNNGEKSVLLEINNVLYELEARWKEENNGDKKTLFSRIIPTEEG